MLGLSRTALLLLSVGAGLGWTSSWTSHALDADIPINYLGSAKPIQLDAAKIQTYEIKLARPMSEEAIDTLVRRLSEYAGVELERVWEIQGKLEGHVLFRSPKDASSTLKIDLRTGDFLFNRGLAPYRKEDDTRGLPPPEQAQRMAREHAEKLGLLPEWSEVVVAHVGGLNMGVHREDGFNSVYKKLVTVRFERNLNGLPVLGSSRLVVHLAEEGRLQGLVRRWLPVEGRQVRLDELNAPGAIIKSIEARLRNEGSGAKRIVVKNTDLVLFDHGGGVIEPAIHVIASLHYEVPVVNSRIVGEVRRLDVPYDTFEPVLKSPRGTYPFMRSPEATRLIETDRPSAIPPRESLPGGEQRQGR